MESLGLLKLLWLHENELLPSFLITDAQRTVLI